MISLWTAFTDLLKYSGYCFNLFLQFRYVFYIYLFSNSIKLTETDLFISGWTHSQYNILLFNHKHPNVVKTKINLKDIEIIYLGYQRNISKLLGIKLSSKSHIKLNRTNVGALLVIKTKENDRLITLGTNVYSKSQLMKLFRKLNELEIHTNIQKGVRI